jgi:uncharacterized membrane protein YeaQ/YmgE (transglycosylase-associated protein family)
MASFGTVVAIMLSAFITGALARFAVPGPDPMPAWLTIVIGLTGSGVGFGVDSATNGHHAAVASLAAFFTAVLCVVAYRKLVQKRPVVGPEALRFPRRGIGVREYRERLQRAGVDPDAMLNRALEQRRRTDEPGRGPREPGEHDREHDDSASDDEERNGPSPSGS